MSAATATLGVAAGMINLLKVTEERLSLDDILFDGEDPMVIAELQYWLGNREAQRQQELKDTAWQKHHREKD